MRQSNQNPKPQKVNLLFMHAQTYLFSTVCHVFWESDVQYHYVTQSLSEHSPTDQKEKLKDSVYKIKLHLTAFNYHGLE